MTPSDVGQLIKTTALPDTVEERVGLLTFNAILSDAARRNSWLALSKQPPAFLKRVAIRERDSDTFLQDGDVPRADTVFLISLSKIAEEGLLRLFFGSSLTEVADGLASFDRVCIADLDPLKGTFASYRARYQCWTQDVPPPFSPSEPLPDPRRTCNDFTRQNAVPDDIRPWLIQTEPEEISEAFSNWKAISARHLMAAIADQVSVGTTGLMYHFSGPPSCKFEIADNDLTGLFPRLTEGATWTFARGGRDSETRHLLLAAEWARSYGRGQLHQLGDGSLDSARAAYSAYVKAGSKETLKALADLRKSVTEDAQKATQRAQDMAGAMWKDLAVATTPFVIKVLPDAGKTANVWFAFFFAVAAAVFLIFSFSTQAFLNQSYLAAQDRFREVWRNRLNQVLSVQEVAEFSEEPINGSIRDYHRVKGAVGFLYGCLVAILLTFAAYEFGEATKPPPAAGSTPPQTGQNSTSTQTPTQGSQGNAPQVTPSTGGLPPQLGTPSKSNPVPLTVPGKQP